MFGASPAEIQSATPGLARWLHRVFTVAGGFMAGAGVLTIAVARNAPHVGDKWTTIALALAGLFTVGTMSLTNRPAPRRAARPRARCASARLRDLGAL